MEFSSYSVCQKYKNYILLDKKGIQVKSFLISSWKHRMCNMGKRPLHHVQTVKVQIRLHISAVWSWHSLFVSISIDSVSRHDGSDRLNCPRTYAYLSSYITQASSPVTHDQIVRKLNVFVSSSPFRAPRPFMILQALPLQTQQPISSPCCKKETHPQRLLCSPQEFSCGTCSSYRSTLWRL